VGIWFIAFRCRVAFSSLCPPDRNTTPGTAAGTVRCSARTVSIAASSGLACCPLTPVQPPQHVRARGVHACMQGSCHDKTHHLTWHVALCVLVLQSLDPTHVNCRAAHMCRVCRLCVGGVCRVCGGQTHICRLCVGCEHMCRVCKGCVYSVCRVCIECV